MPKKFDCKTCQTKDSKEFYPNRKNICKKCIAENQRKDYEEKKELLEKLKAEESKPETPRAPSPSPSPHNYETFQTAVNDLSAFIDSQALNFQKVTQDFELYKFNSEAKIQALQSQILTLMSQIQTIESRPIIIPVSSPISSSSSSSASSSPESSPAPSRVPSPIMMRSKSPVKENPIKTEYKEIIEKVNEDYTLIRKGKRSINYTLKELEALCKTYKINRHGSRNQDDIALVVIKDLQNRINVC